MSPKDREMHQFFFESPDGKSPAKRASIIATKDGPLTEEEIERLRRENIELMEELKRYQAQGVGNKTACCSIF
jgi:hypothetical protein